MPSRELAVLIVTSGEAEPLDRALAGVEKWLPESPVHVWDNRSDATPAIQALAARRPDVTWTFSDFDLGRVAALNRLMAQVPEADALQLDPRTELLGPLTRARRVLAEPGVAAVSPAVLDAAERDRPWDVARRTPSLPRELAASVGRPGDRYPTAPTGALEGHLLQRALLVSRDAWHALGPYDERRLLSGGHEATWQAAARAAGWTLRLVDDPDPQARHEPSPGPTPRGRALESATRAIVLGGRRNVGRGSVLAGATSLLDRRDRRDVSAGLPAVVIISNGLELGGAERQRVMLANELTARGHAVTVVALQKLGPYTAELDPRVRLRMQPFWQSVLDVPGDEAILVSGVTNTEIAFALAWRAQGRLARQRRWWMPATHDPAELDRPTYTDPQARALRTADALLVLATQHHVDLTRHQRLTDTVMVAPNGLPMSEARPRPYRPAHEAGPVRFGMLIRILEYKNPLLLADALDALDRPGDWTLDIFGEGPDRAALEARTPAHLRERVRWRGRSFGPDEAFDQLDVLCVPSGFEAFPLVMVEAMLRAVPVMASVSGAVPEMLDDGRAGIIVDPLTRERWTEALRAVLDDPDRTAALGVAGRERAVAHFSVAAMTDDYQRAFSRLVGHPIPGAPTDPARTL